MDLREAMNMLDKIYEAANNRYARESGKSINLSDCRMIETDVVDIRGEYETNACVDYYPTGSSEPVLTRVQIRIILTRETNDGKEFLAHRTRFGFQLPGGGYDANKDGGDILNTAKREVYEEFNINMKNVVDTGVTSWRYREDPWVAMHVANPEDRWNGYFSYYITGEYDSDSDNEAPEDIDNFKWYPISMLLNGKDVLYKQAAKNLTEGAEPADGEWGSGAHGKQDYTIPGAISYCCESPVQLKCILESGLVKASQTAETHETDLEHSAGRGRPKLKEYKYVSFSKQLYSHAYRRPNKWSFGILVDEEELVRQGYEFTDRDHEYNSLQFVSVFKSEDGKYMTKTTLFGYVEISEEIYNIILEAMKKKAARRAPEYVGNNEPIRRGLSLTKDKAWDVIDRKIEPTSYRNANKELNQINFNTKTSIAGSIAYESQFSVYITEFNEIEHDKILDYLLRNTYYNEGERRFWCKHGEPGVFFDERSLYGIILSKIVEPFIDEFGASQYIDEDLQLDDEQYEALRYICQYVVDRKLSLFIHDAADEYHMSKLGTIRGIKTKGTR